MGDRDKRGLFDGKMDMLPERVEARERLTVPLLEGEKDGKDERLAETLEDTLRDPEGDMEPDTEKVSVDVRLKQVVGEAQEDAVIEEELQREGEEVVDLLRVFEEVEQRVGVGVGLAHTVTVEEVEEERHKEAVETSEDKPLEEGERDVDIVELPLPLPAPPPPLLVGVAANNPVPDTD